LFEAAPLVIDLRCEELNEQEILSIRKQCISLGFKPVGIRAEHFAEKAVLAGLPLLTAASQGRSKTITVPKPEVVVEKVVEQIEIYKPPMLLDKPVRSGQQVYAKGCDLIVTANVGEGAEVIADGNIHIYGSLRGRALAGAQGDHSARIFCQKLEAELVSIAGSFKLKDSINENVLGKPVHICLKDDEPSITAI